MKFEESKHEFEDTQVELALRNFRESVHGWSEQEYARPRVIKRSRWDAIFRLVANPVMAGSLASALVITSVGVPVRIHHERQVVAEQNAARERQLELAKEAREQQANAMTDDELLSHVDSDIAQGAPDAMQPLASMMTDAAGN
jgi:hypothetical protein